MKTEVMDYFLYTLISIDLMIENWNSLHESQQIILGIDIYGYLSAVADWILIDIDLDTNLFLENKLLPLYRSLIASSFQFIF